MFVVIRLHMLCLYICNGKSSPQSHSVCPPDYSGRGTWLNNTGVLNTLIKKEEHLNINAPPKINDNSNDYKQIFYLKPLSFTHATGEKNNPVYR